MKPFFAALAAVMLFLGAKAQSQCPTLSFEDLKKINTSLFPEDVLLEKNATRLDDQTWALCYRVLCQTTDSVSKVYNERLFFPGEEDSISISMIYYTYSTASYTAIKNKAKAQMKYKGKHTVGEATLDYFTDGKYYYSFTISTVLCNVARENKNFYEIRFYKEKPAYLD